MSSLIMIDEMLRRLSDYQEAQERTDAELTDEANRCGLQFLE